MTLHEFRAMARTTLDEAPRPPAPTTSSTRWTLAAEAGSPLGRLWNPLDIAVSAVVDTARNGLLTVRHGDSGDLRSARRAPAPGGTIMASGAAAVAASEWRETVFPAGA